MRTYCKNIDVMDKDFVVSCIFDCFDGKWRRKTVRRLISQFSDFTESQIRQMVENDQKYILYPAIDNIANYIIASIYCEDIVLPPIKYDVRYDNNSKKDRVIGTQSMIHQCFEYVAVNACKELFNKKIGTFQCASIPGKGQNYGKKAIKKWMNTDVSGTKYAVKADIKKCYPSIDQNVLKSFLHRDIKNKKLLYLLDTLIEKYGSGISIGSHLSQWLCNYYLSYAYQYISEKLFKIRNTKKGAKNVRLISHVLFYMDDIILFGNNKKYLIIATEMMIRYFNDILHLQIKPNWRLFRVIYADKSGKIHGSFVDMMGFRFYRNGKVTIRRSIFLKLKRKYLRMRKKINNGEFISLQAAQSLMSYYGWIVGTNSYKVFKKLEIERITNIARKVISANAKKKSFDRKSWNRYRSEKLIVNL